MRLKLIPFIISFLLICDNSIFGQITTWEEYNNIVINEPTSLKDFRLKGKVKSYTHEVYENNKLKGEDTLLLYFDKYIFNSKGYITIKERMYSDNYHNTIDYYTYDNNNNLINIKTQSNNGLIENNLYYQNNKCVKREYFKINERYYHKTYTYHNARNSIQINYYNGDTLYKSQNLVYDKNNNLILADGEKIANYKYDKNNNIIRKKEFNGKYRFKYNKINQLTKISSYYKGKLYEEINYSYDSLGNNIKSSTISDPKYYGLIVRVKEKTILNDKGKVTEIKRYYNDEVSKNNFKYNDDGLLIRETYKSKNDRDYYRDEYTYDSKKNLIEKRIYEKNNYKESWFKYNNTEQSKIEKYFYNDKNQNNIIIRYYGNNWIYDIDSIFYLQNSLKGIQNKYSFNNLDSTFSIIRTDTFRYDHKNRLINHSFLYFEDRTIEDYTYNDFDSIIYISEKLFNKNDTLPITRHLKRTYNSKGLLIEEENTRDNNFYNYIFNYDEKGRLKVVTNKEDNIVRQMFYYRKNGKIKELFFYSEGKYNWKEDPYIITYTYDKFGNIIFKSNDFNKNIYEYYE